MVQVKILQIKFCDTAIIPSELVKFDSHLQIYRVATGETVRLDYRMTCDNSRGIYDEYLDGLCREVHGMSFKEVRSAWYGRLGVSSKFWHKVKMVKC